MPLHVSATGLTTSLIPHPSGNSFQVDFDLRAHRLEIVTVLGGRRSITRKSGPVADFYSEVMHRLIEPGVDTTIWPMPVEIEDAIPIDTDTAHTVYDAEQAHRFWRALVQMVRVFEQFRSSLPSGRNNANGSPA